MKKCKSNVSKHFSDKNMRKMAEGGLVGAMSGMSMFSPQERARFRQAAAANFKNDLRTMQESLMRGQDVRDDGIRSVASADQELRDMAGVERMSDGGKVRGKGGPRDDKIGPVMLSDGEYVLPADTVKAVGVGFLDQLRNATHTYSSPAKRNGMANGGMATKVSPEELIRSQTKGMNPQQYADYLTRNATGGAQAQRAAYDATQARRLADAQSMQDFKANNPGKPLRTPSMYNPQAYRKPFTLSPAENPYYQSAKVTPASAAPPASAPPPAASATPPAASATPPAAEPPANKGIFGRMKEAVARKPDVAVNLKTGETVAAQAAKPGLAARAAGGAMGVGRAMLTSPAGVLFASLLDETQQDQYQFDEHINRYKSPDTNAAMQAAGTVGSHILTGLTAASRGLAGIASNFTGDGAATDTLRDVANNRFILQDGIEGAVTKFFDWVNGTNVGDHYNVGYRATEDRLDQQRQQSQANLARSQPMMAASEQPPMEVPQAQAQTPVNGALNVLENAGIRATPRSIDEAVALQSMLPTEIQRLQYAEQPASVLDGYSPMGMYGGNAMVYGASRNGSEKPNSFYGAGQPAQGQSPYAQAIQKQASQALAALGQAALGGGGASNQGPARPTYVADDSYETRQRFDAMRREAEMTFGRGAEGNLNRRLLQIEELRQKALDNAAERTVNMRGQDLTSRTLAAQNQMQALASYAQTASDMSKATMGEAPDIRTQIALERLAMDKQSASQEMKDKRASSAQAMIDRIMTRDGEVDNQEVNAFNSFVATNPELLQNLIQRLGMKGASLGDLSQDQQLTVLNLMNTAYGVNKSMRGSESKSQQSMVFNPFHPGTTKAGLSDVVQGRVGAGQYVWGKLPFTPTEYVLDESGRLVRASDLTKDQLNLANQFTLRGK